MAHPAQRTTSDGSAMGGRIPGRSIVAGRSVDDLPHEPSRLMLQFSPVSPATGSTIAERYTSATEENVNAAASRAWEAYFAMREIPASSRADLLGLIADRLGLLGDDLPQRASEETGFSAARMTAERERTMSVLRWLSEMVRQGQWSEPTVEAALPSRRPMPKPDLRRMLRPIGPVLVISPATAPILHGPAGLDSMGALAAGCPVIFKSHPLHPGTDEMVGWAIASAIEELDLHPGMFGLLHAGGREGEAVGQRLASHPCVRAIAGCCSTRTLATLGKLAEKRGDGLPLLLCAGTANPCVIMPDALRTWAESIGRGLAEATMLAGGQTMHRPSVVLACSSPELEALVHELELRFRAVEQAVAVSAEHRARFDASVDRLSKTAGVSIRCGGVVRAGEHAQASAGPSRMLPVLARTSSATLMKHPELYEEVLGPMLLVVGCQGENELLAALASFPGVQNVCLWMGQGDGRLARRMVPAAEQRTARLVVNAMPTAVEQCPALALGGVFPASGWATGPSGPAGFDMIRRFCRPVSYQSLPQHMLPAELRGQAKPDETGTDESSEQQSARPAA